MPVLVIAFCEKRRKLFALANTGAVSGFLESLLRRSIFCSLLKTKVKVRFDQIYTYSIIPPFTLPPTVLASSPDNSHKSSRIVSSQMNAWSGAIDVLRISRFSSSRMLLKID